MTAVQFLAQRGVDATQAEAVIRALKADDYAVVRGTGAVQPEAAGRPETISPVR